MVELGLLSSREAGGSTSGPAPTPLSTFSPPRWPSVQGPGLGSEAARPKFTELEYDTLPANP